MNFAVKTQFVSVCIKVRVQQSLLQHPTFLCQFNRHFRRSIHSIVTHTTVIFLGATLSRYCALLCTELVFVFAHLELTVTLMHSGNRHLKIINFTLNAIFDQFLFVANETANFTLFYNCLVCLLLQVLFCVQKV